MTYEPANPITVPASGGCQPGVRAFEQFFGRWWGLPSLGCYNPASVVPGGGPSLHRDGRADPVGAARLACRRMEVGVDETDRDAVDPHALGGHLACEPDGERVERGLARGVVHVLPGAALRC